MDLIWNLFELSCVYRKLTQIWANLDEEYYLQFELSKPKPSYLKPIYLAHMSKSIEI